MPDRSILTVADVFEAVAYHRDLAGTTQILGEAQDATLTTPRIVWSLAGSDAWEPSNLQSKPAVIDGIHVHLEGVVTRVAGAEIRLVVEAGPEPRHTAALENLIRLFVATLHEVCRGFGNFRLLAGKPMERETLAAGEMGYILPIQFLCPIFRTLGAADVRSISTLPGRALTADAADVTPPDLDAGTAASAGANLTGTGTASVDLSLGVCVAVLSSGSLGLPDGSEARAAAILGVSIGDYASGAEATYAVSSGRVTGLEGLTPGTELWAGTAGALVPYADVASGDWTRPMGVADSSTTFRLLIGSVVRKP